ncbi:MAG: MerR family transcriptional regulator, partial [Methanomicrobiales archaeon]|nr:MerR family transcriptional regulator [Methanomicrobiales archaeon]
KTLCGLGFSLFEIDVLLKAKAGHDTSTIREMFGKRRGEIRSEVKRLQQIEAILANGEASLESIYMSLNEPIIKDVPPQRIVGKRGTGPYGEIISRLMPELCSQVSSEENQKNGLRVTGPPMTLYHDTEYREKDGTMEVVLPITGKIVLSDPEMEVRTLPGGKVLSLIHKGSYSGLHEAWSRIGAYAEQREFVLTGSHQEVYLNDPSMVPEDELLTELQIPVDTKTRGKIS